MNAIGALPCLVLPHLEADGPANMALDAAMLEAAGRDGSAAYLRTYGWTAPTLSLGYFQAVAEAEADPRWRSAPTVRRPTGGGAIWHDREVTYALAIPASHPAARRPGDLYEAVHGAIAGLLRERGAPASRRGGATNPGIRPFLCFTDRDPEDIVIAGVKVVGSAQRRRAGAVLQHGSLLLSHAEAAPELLGVADLVGVEVAAAPWSASLQARIPEALGLSPRAEGVSESMRLRAAELELGTFRDPAWSRRR